MNINVDILIVTATKIESSAIIDSFSKFTGKMAKPISINKRMYQDLGVINDNTVYLVQSEMGSSGLGASLLTVQESINTLSPSAVIMAGIAFGIDKNKQSIGDILVSRRLSIYESQRVGTSIDGEPVIILRGDRPHASTWLIDCFRSADMYWDKSNPKVRFGLLLSGEKLVDNKNLRDQLKQFEPEAIGGEMEGAGLYVACQESKTDWIIVKSICDWADGKKSRNKKRRQQIASSNTAKFVIHVLQHTTINSTNEVNNVEKSKFLDHGATKKEIQINQEFQKDLKAENIIEIPSTISPYTISISNNPEIVEFTLKMRETNMEFTIQSQSIIEVSRVATFLAATLLPNLMNKGYEWSIVHNNKEIPGNHTLKTAGINDGDEVYLIGTHAKPEIRPFKGVS